MEGDAIGRVLAHYVVRYVGGEAIRLPIRERFEVSVVPTIWGQWPFLAVPEQKTTSRRAMKVAGRAPGAARRKPIMPIAMTIICGPGATRTRSESSNAGD